MSLYDIFIEIRKRSVEDAETIQLAHAAVISLIHAEIVFHVNFALVKMNEEGPAQKSFIFYKIMIHMNMHEICSLQKQNEWL